MSSKKLMLRAFFASKYCILFFKKSFAVVLLNLNDLRIESSLLVIGHYISKDPGLHCR